MWASSLLAFTSFAKNTIDSAINFAFLFHRTLLVPTWNIKCSRSFYLIQKFMQSSIQSTLDPGNCLTQAFLLLFILLVIFNPWPCLTMLYLNTKILSIFLVFVFPLLCLISSLLELWQSTSLQSINYYNQSNFGFSNVFMGYWNGPLG